MDTNIYIIIIFIACLRQMVAFAPKIIFIACLRQVVTFAPQGNYYCLPPAGGRIRSPRLNYCAA
jgi:hypothetical protein